MPLTRSVVIGTSGSGKSTFAQRLSEAAGAPHIELDTLYWNPNWQASTDDEFERKVRDAIAADAWVIDGNYSSVRPIIWQRATAILWLNYPFALTFLRLFHRSIRRLVTREELFNGNRESFSSLFLSRESLLLWAIKTHPRYRRDYPRELQRFPHVELHEFLRPAQAEAFMSGIERAGS